MPDFPLLSSRGCLEVIWRCSMHQTLASYSIGVLELAAALFLPGGDRRAKHYSCVQHSFHLWRKWIT